MDITDIRIGNVRDILNVLRFGEGMTKKEIAQTTELSFSTVSNLCNALKEKNILIDEKLENSAVGRNPNKLFFQHNRFCSVCLDLQMKDVLRFSILNFHNDVLYQNPYHIAQYKTPEEIVAFAVHIFEQMRSFPWLEGISFIGIGVAVSGIFDKDTRRIIASSIPIFENAPLADLIEKEFSLPCYVDNEANLCAISMRQRSHDAKDLVYLHISEGTGVGVIAHGNLLRGKNGYAAEISHMPLGDPDAICPSCGSYGCLESALSLEGLTRGLVDCRPNETLIEAFQRLTQMIRQNPADFQGYLRDKGEKLGVVLSILINLFDPQAVYIGGDITAIFDLLLPFFENQINQRCALPMQKGLTLVCDADSEMSIFLGINQSIYEGWNPLNEKDRNHQL